MENKIVLWAIVALLALIAALLARAVGYLGAARRHTDSYSIKLGTCLTEIKLLLEQIDQKRG